MKIDSFITYSHTILSKFDNKRQFYFGYFCAHRFLPIYKSFSIKNNWGDSNYLSNAINETLQSYLSSNNKDSIKEINQFIYENLIPDLDDFKVIEAHYALNASLNVNYLLDFALNEDFELIKEIVSNSFELTELIREESKEFDLSFLGLTDFDLSLREIEIQKFHLSLLSLPNLNDEIISECSGQNKL